jgi:hypothetical protein
VAERLLLEGSDLAELMVHVRSEFGPHARIIRADRVRSGGIAGFFAKEKYELTVDVPTMPPPPVRPLRAHRPPPSSLSDLLDAADEAEAALAPDPVVAQEAIAARPDAAAAAATPRAATGGAQFATVLDQVRALADQGLPAEAFSPLAPTPVRADGPVGAAAGPASATGDPDLAGAAAAAAPSPTVSPSPGAPPGPAPASAAALRSTLAASGVPAELLQAVPLTLAAVLAAIPAAPALPRAPGQVLVLVGTQTDVQALEPLLVDRMRLSPPDVVHVGATIRIDSAVAGPDRPTRVTSLQALSAWRARAPLARHPWLVVVPVDGDAEARAEAAELLSTARADQVWGVVDARTKPADAQRWLEQVGARRRVDAIAVRASLDTSAPGTVLGLGRPVAWVDGMPTSRVVWAAILGQPLDAALS